MFFTYKLTKIFFDKKITLYTLILVAFLPLSITYTSMHASEMLFSAILILAIYLFFTKNNPYIIGLLIGYLTLIRPIGMFVPIIFIVYLFFKNELTFKNKIKYFLKFGLIVVLVITPWLIRNYNAFGKFVYSTNGGYVFYINNNDYATGSWSDPYKYPNSPIIKYKTENGFDEIGIDEEGKKLALQWIKKNPSKFLKLGFLRILNSYWLKTDDIMWSMTIAENSWHSLTPYAVFLEKIIYMPYNVLIFIYFIFNLINIIRTKKIDFHFFLLLIFLYFNGMMFLLEGNSRYVFPLQSLYSIGVVYIIIQGFNKWRCIKS